MKLPSIWPFFFIAALCAASISLAQDKPCLSPTSSSTLQAYDLNRESTLVGTVLSYSSSSQTAPIGPRVSLQTSSGIIDIHLGDARLLAANQFNIQPGDSLRIVGENIRYSGGTQFVARFIQHGTQALLLRTNRGFPITRSAPRRAADSAKQGSAL